MPAEEDVASRQPVDPGRRPIRQRSRDEREDLAERIADRLDVPITAAGVVFLLLVLAETISDPQGAVGAVFSVTSWVLWALFVAEFVLRLVIAPSTSTFLKRNWWQLAFLAVPALRFVRALRVLRAARVGRVLSSAVRSSRTAGRQPAAVRARRLRLLRGRPGRCRPGHHRRRAVLERRDDDDRRLRAEAVSETD